MKKLLITIICILAVLTFASCSNNNSNDLASGKSISQESSSYENEESKSATSTATEKEITTSITETTIQKETQPATDKDGWITKWY